MSALTADEAAAVDEAAAEEREQAVTPLELFFDLVLVLSFTQVTALMADQPTVEGIARGLLVLAALWWAWVGYSWLTNVIQPEETPTRLAIFGAMAALLVVALAIPGAFEDDGYWFAGAYAVVRGLHILLFGLAPNKVGVRKAVLQFAPGVAVACTLIAVALQLEGTAQLVVFALAVVIDLGAAALVSSWKLPAAGHFAERHGLILIIALGESIVAIGIGAEDVDQVTLAVAAAAVLGIALSAALWWSYFDVVAPVAEHELEHRHGQERVKLAREAFSYLHYVLIAAIVLVALGLKKTVGHTGDELKAVPAFALVGGVGLYYLGHVLLRLRTRGTLATRRLVFGVVLVALAFVADEVPSLVVLALLTLAVAGLVAYEVVRFAEARRRLRREGHVEPRPARAPA